jgi:hypothetical protein
MATIDDRVEVSQAPETAPARPFALVLYAATLFLSALLIFAIQPMFTKMVLPKLGGSPSVWSVAMVVFQAALFIGYVYAHLLARALKPKWAALVHLLFLAVVAMTLPFGIAKGFGTPPEHGVTLWLVGLFFASIGLPFIALAASAPLLQNWFISTGHRQAVNPYVLYAASNLGSFAALLAYPFAIEPLFALQTQTSLWSAGFYALAVLVAVAACFAASRTIKGQDAEDVAERSSALRRLSWTALAAIPSALVIAVTAHISTDLAAAPLLWVIPLALYLLTFVAVFRERPWIDHALVQRLVPYGVLPLAINAFGGDRMFWFLVISINLFIFVLVALACHGEAYRTRPHRGRLTEFYLWISFGGAIGGVFAGLIAPNIFNNTYEYPLVLTAALLLLPAMFEGGWRQFLRDASLALTAALIIAAIGIGYDVRLMVGFESTRVAALIVFTLLAALILFFRKYAVRLFPLVVLVLAATRLWQQNDGAIATVRSFFGVHRVVETPDGKFHVLFHGTTIHGALRVRDDAGNPLTGKPEPTTYYYFGGPIGETIEAVRGARGTLDRVAAVGLGSGSLSCHRKDGEQWTIFEIDPEVVRIARNPKLFRFLTECAPQTPIVLGDARLTLAASPEKFDLIILDAFSSDAIPAHLLTREALAVYLAHLSPHGAILFHVSNRHMELASVVAAVGALEGLIAYGKEDRNVFDFNETFRANAHVVVLARDVADLGDLPTRPGWDRVSNTGVAPWTDDYANVLSAIIRRKFGH